MIDFNRRVIDYDFDYIENQFKEIIDRYNSLTPNEFVNYLKKPLSDIERREACFYLFELLMIIKEKRIFLSYLWKRMRGFLTDLRFSD